MQLKKTAITSHRNGIDGAPFHVVLFQHDSREMVGVVFDAAHHVAVFDAIYLASGVIAFGSNSWRGDEFEPALREIIENENHKT